jgi:hypothetical protein
MRARGVLVCPRADRVRRGLRVWFIPEGTTFQEEPTHQDSREPCYWWACELQTHPTRHARTFLRARRACTVERRQWLCTLRSSPGRRRVQADPQCQGRVLADQPQGRVRRRTPGHGVCRRERGRYRFESNVPVSYGGRPPHIHVRVRAPGYEELVTQHYPERGQRKANVDLVLLAQ